MPNVEPSYPFFCFSSSYTLGVPRYLKLGCGLQSLDTLMTRNWLCFQARAKAARRSFELYASLLAGFPKFPRSILRPTLA